MKSMKCGIGCLLIISAVSAKGQSPKINMDMAKYFSGNWAGAGEFANGKKVEADVSFYISTDSTSLINIYADKAPNRYKATSAWAVAPGGKTVAHIINNFTGLNDFTSDGWQNGKIILANTSVRQGRGTLYQQFVFEKIDDDHFRVTYYYGFDIAKLKEGDHLVFAKITME